MAQAGRIRKRAFGVAVVVAGLLAGAGGIGAVVRGEGDDRGSPDDRAAVEAVEHDSQAGHGIHGGHGADESPEQPLSGPEAERFAAQWRQAEAAAAELATVEQAAAAGYAQAGPQVPGVGTHWIHWGLVDAPFDPSRPSMLLFDETPGRPARLAGFSYWVRDAAVPAGFAGPNDHWHQHTGLCFVDGWLQREDVPAAGECTGEWFEGGDRWMLHAWVVPDLPNPAGRFAGRHRALCPSDWARVADVARCDPLTT